MGRKALVGVGNRIQEIGGEMTRKNVAIEFVEEAFCDLCGAKISDGKHDGVGGINFWGAFLRMVRRNEESITMRRDVYDDSAVIEVDWGFKTEWEFEVCRACAKKAIEAIRRLKEAK